MYIKDIQALSATLNELQEKQNIKGLLLFCADKDQPNHKDLLEVLQINTKPLIGGIFPEIIADGERKERGFVIVPIYEDIDVHCFSQANDTSIAEQISQKQKNMSLEISSVFCFVNALWPEKTSFMQSLYDEFGSFVNYLGGGAGSLSFKSFPCVFCNQQILENAAVVGFIQSPMRIGVAHGWHPISEPIKVTETKGNSILSLNWKPAVEVYKSYIEEHAQKPFDEKNFFDTAKSYPLGMVKLDDEMVIRDPYATENGVLHIVDEVPEGVYIRIMHGNMPSLLDGAKQAAEKMNESSEEKYSQLCIDCISRVLFMQEDFSQELQYLNRNQEANGVLSIGEIANPGNSALELYNKTIVLAQWKKNN